MAEKKRRSVANDNKRRPVGRGTSTDSSTTRKVLQDKPKRSSQARNRAGASSPAQDTSISIRSRSPQTFAGLLHDGSRLATIQEVLDPDVETRIWKDLSSEEMQRLCLKRIKENDNFISMRMLGTVGVIDKRKALTEIKRLSPIGLHLMEIERRYIRLQLEHHHLAEPKG